MYKEKRRLKNKESNFVSAVVYIHNDEKNIGKFIKGLLGVLNENFKEFEIVCVDDNSTDKSVNTIKDILKKEKVDNTVNLISLSFFHGVELAMNAGIDMSIGDFVYEFDCINMDFEWNMIMQVYRKELEGFDITSAAPDLKGRWSSKLFYWLLKHENENVANMRTESFRLVSRRAINRVNAMNIDIPFRQIAYASSGLNITSISFVPHNTNYNLNIFYRKNLAVNVILIFTSICDKIIVALSVFAAILGLIQMIKRKAGGESKILLSGVFLMLGVIIKYLKVINNFIFKKQHYIVGGVEKINNSI